MSQQNPKGRHHQQQEQQPQQFATSSDKNTIINNNINSKTFSPEIASSLQHKKQLKPYLDDSFIHDKLTSVVGVQQEDSSSPSLKRRLPAARKATPFPLQTSPFAPSQKSPFSPSSSSSSATAPTSSSSSSLTSSTEENTKKVTRKEKKQTLIFILIKYAFEIIAIMVSLWSLFNPTKKNRLPPINDQLLLTPAHKLSILIKDGQLTSQRVVRAFIDRIRSVQPLINAVAEERFEEALLEAKQLDERLAQIRQRQQQQQNNIGDSQQTLDHLDNDDDRLLWQSPLAGIPISVKESIAVKGMRQTCGLWSRRECRAPEDSQVVYNARKMGLIPIVTTNIPELTLYWADCRNKVYGRTHNPYDLSRVPGASSGGEGSLLGSGGSLLGIGSDIGGSLRIPAHFCGIFSHKPSPYAVSSKGNYPELLERRLRIFTLGPMARYASDLKPMLKCMMLDHIDTSAAFDKDGPELDLVQEQKRQEQYELDLMADSPIDDNDKSQKEQKTPLIQKYVPLNLDSPVYLSDVTVYYCDNTDSTIKPSLAPLQDMVEGLKEIVDHLSTKYNCRTKKLNLDKYFHYAMIQWHIMMKSSPTSDAVKEIKEQFGLDSMQIEWLRLFMGTSKHTIESILAVMITAQGPNDPVTGPQVCSKFEKQNKEMRKEMNEILGDNGVLIMPTMPNVALKRNEGLLRTPDLRYTILFNILLCPVTQAVFGFDKQNNMPFGYSIAAKPGMDRLTLAVAEEIESRFSGWRLEPDCNRANDSVNLKDSDLKVPINEQPMKVQSSL